MILGWKCVNFELKQCGSKIITGKRFFYNILVNTGLTTCVQSLDQTMCKHFPIFNRRLSFIRPICVRHLRRCEQIKFIQQVRHGWISPLIFYKRKEKCFPATADAASRSHWLPWILKRCWMNTLFFLFLFYLFKMKNVGILTIVSSNIDLLDFPLSCWYIFFFLFSFDLLRFFGCWYI